MKYKTWQEVINESKPKKTEKPILVGIREMIDKAHEELREIEYIQIPHKLASEIVLSMIESTGREPIRDGDSIYLDENYKKAAELQTLYGEQVKLGEPLKIKLVGIK